jgi:acetyl-CoA decarbonylase/synthase complex subunit gamma
MAVQKHQEKDQVGFEAANPPWVVGYIETPAGGVPRVSTRLTWRDRLGAMAMRWSIGRGRYRVAPGLYAVGHPAGGGPLLASANYKLSFDALRKAMDGLDAWLLVLDTKGINVWCAAGKGTFGTDELVNRVAVTGVGRTLAGATLILPQLGAPGIAGHEVQRRTGLKVVYGPVYADDIPAFLKAGMQASPAMRRVRFRLWDRLVVVPVEAVHRFMPALLAMLVFFLAAGVGRNGYSVAMVQWPGIAVAVLGNFLVGVVVTPALLPWLPGRSFALKGAETGLVTAAALWWFAGYGVLEGVGVGLMSLAACSFLNLMFTGCTPYTSMSGVRRELRWAVPLQIVAAAAGLVFWLVARWR